MNRPRSHAQQTMRPEDLLVFIFGHGHSGSTLLDMLLGGHSMISSLGEVGYLTYYAHELTSENFCTCSSTVFECPFWSKVGEALKTQRDDPTTHPFKTLFVSDIRLALVGRLSEIPEPLPEDVAAVRSRFRELLLLLGSRKLLEIGASASESVRIHMRASANRHRVYDAVRRAHGTPVIVDSSKTAGFLKSLYVTRRTPMRILYLTRDGRAVSHSYIRRKNLPMERAAQLWRSEQIKLNLVLRTMPSRLIIRTKYEDLCSQPERELARICSFIGVSAEPAMLDFRKDRHNLGGNRMRRRTREQAIRLDEQWRQSLTDEELDEFDRIAGRVNRGLGYV